MEDLSNFSMGYAFVIPFHFSIVIFVVFTVLQSPVYALPIGFGYNQGDYEFMELKTDDFTVYHDKRAPEDAKLALKSLEAAKPNLERWFEVKRTSPLVINMSAASDNASFANFITDSVELQTLGQGGRDLAWHEYTHAMMYQHLNNWFGPAGAILHLPWMEAWFLEGLAEAVSVSLGSDEQAGIERYHALSGNWPTWDRIHSLYTSGPFNYRGYATSGGFVAWILRTYDANKLPHMLREFQSKSMPWYWPWALVPMNGFLPMDDALKHLTGKRGKELYEQYKTEATEFWKSQSRAPFVTKNLPTNNLSRNPWAWEFYDQRIRKKSPGANVVGVLESNTRNARAWIGEHWPKANKRGYSVHLAETGLRPRKLLRDATWLEGPWISYQDVWWIETAIETTKLCKAPRNNFKSSAITCSLSTSMPKHLRVLGHKQDTATLDAAILWLARDTETTHGDHHEMIEVQLATGVDRVVKNSIGGRPISMASTKQDRWVLTGDRSFRYLVKLEDDDTCQGIIRISDFPVRIIGSNKDLPSLVVYTAEGYGSQTLDPEEFHLEKCRPLSRRSSPLLEAMQSKTSLSFKEAIVASNIWDSRQVISSVENSREKSNDKLTDPAIDPTIISASIETEHSAAKHATSAEPISRPARWRGRPIFAFPWIGADDALGPQIGIITVPLMDEMQNETVRFTGLVGVASRFPYQDLTITTNRFIPTWSATAFRAQTYNGRYRDKESGNIYSRYVEEVGSHLDGSYGLGWRHLEINLNWGFKNSILKPYIGPTKLTGRLNESYAGLLISGTNRGSLYANTSMRTRIASPGINDVFHYDVVGVAATTGALIGKGKIELGIDTSRTRGPRRRDLQEMYSPLKTLIPGSGAGYNQTNYAITEDYGLFSPVFGENQARARILATHPLIEDVDKFTGLVYIDRLDISGFFNYGTAWRGDELPKKENLIAAQGYSADLFMDNKGVNFNFGMGLGQVLGTSWQAYWTFGFDAFF